MVQHRFFIVVSIALLFANLASGCGRGGRAIQSPMVGKKMYAQSNLYLNRGELSAVNYRTGTFVPIGTPIEVKEIRTDSITARLVESGRTFVFVPYRTPNTPILDVFRRFFSEEPQNLELDALPEDIRAKVEAAEIAPGMSKETVMMSLGPPPLHANPKKEATTWRYWRNRFVTFEVEFDDLGFVKRDDGEAAPVPEPEAASDTGDEERIVLYAACNVHNENSVISWVNYLHGPVIPIGTKIVVTDRGPESVVFHTDNGQQKFRFENDDAKSGVATWVLFTRMFAQQSPTEALDALPTGKKALVLGAQVEPGMSKDAVKMAWCPAPPHETPSYESSVWKYWKSKVDAVEIRFDDKEEVLEINN